MERTLYALKINISNELVHDLYEEGFIEEFQADVYKRLSKYKGVSNYEDYKSVHLEMGDNEDSYKAYQPFVYTTTGTYIDDNGNKKEREFDYKFYDFNVDNHFQSIHGKIHKEYNMFRNKFVDGELIPEPFENNELVDFYYSVPDELVIFYRKQRFGTNEITKAFQALLNEYVDQKYRLECELIREGFSIQELKEKISGHNDMKKLVLTYKVPNMALKDARDFKEKAKSYADQMRIGNVREIKEEITGYDSGINGDSDIIQDAVKRATEMIPESFEDKATSRKYVTASITHTDGTEESTETSKAKTAKISDRDIKKGKFIEIARKLTSFF